MFVEPLELVVLAGAVAALVAPPLPSLVVPLLVLMPKASTTAVSRPRWWRRASSQTAR